MTFSNADFRTEKIPTFLLLLFYCAFKSEFLVLHLQWTKKWGKITDFFQILNYIPLNIRNITNSSSFLVLVFYLF